MYHIRKIGRNQPLKRAVRHNARKCQEQLKLLRKAHPEYIYLDYLNKNFKELFNNEHAEKHSYTPYLYAGMLFDVSMAWLDNDCADDVGVLVDMMVDAIYFS